VQVVADDLQLTPDELVVEWPAGDTVETESGVVTDTPGSQGSFVLCGNFGVIEIHTCFPFGHFLLQTRRQREGQADIRTYYLLK
jgi:hypothetical protein